MFAIHGLCAFSEFWSVTGTETVDVSAGNDDDNVGSHLSFGSRPHYYDTLDDGTEKPSVPSVASSFIKMQSSSSNVAVYNSVAKKLMVCLTMLASFPKNL